MAKKTSWPKIGTLRKGETGSYIKLEKNVTILVDGQAIDLNEKGIIQLQDPRSKLDKMYENGYISEKDYESRRATLAENQWLRYELVAPPNKNS